MTKRTLILSLLFGASVAAGGQLLKWQLTVSPDQKMTEVIVLMRDVPRGKTLTAEMLTKRKYLASALPFGVVSNMDEAVGRVTSVAIRTGVLLENTMAPKGTLAGLQGMIPEGKRAFTIRTPNVASGVAGLVQPGDRVDVLLTVDGEEIDDDTGGATMVTLLRDIEVLAVDQHLDGSAATPPPSEKSRGRASSMQAAIKSVTLIASPDQAMRLGLAQSKGTLQLSLRSPGSTPEDDFGGVVAITFNDLLGRTKKVLRKDSDRSVSENRDSAGDRRTTEPAAPVPEPPALPPIVMLRGTSRSTVSVSLVQGRQSAGQSVSAPNLTSAQVASTGR